MSHSDPVLPTADQDCAVASILQTRRPYSDTEALSIAAGVLAAIIEHVGAGAAYQRLASAIGLTISNPTAMARWRRMHFREAGDVTPLWQPRATQTEVTEEMIRRGEDAYNRMVHDGDVHFIKDLLPRLYRAMAAAAPGQIP